MPTYKSKFGKSPIFKPSKNNKQPRQNAYYKYMYCPKCRKKGFFYKKSNNYYIHYLCNCHITELGQRIKTKTIKDSDITSHWEKNSVVVTWTCNITKKINETSKNAIYHNIYGWICNCGRWTTGNDSYHKPLKYEIRTIYKNAK